MLMSSRARAPGATAAAPAAVPAPGMSSVMGNALSGAWGVLTHVVPSLSRTSEHKEPLDLSEHDFEDFSDLFRVNDQMAAQISEGFSEEDIKKHALQAPRVVVIGLTSAGKSSLLERVVGQRIFPVKDTVCTRRPFAVHLRKDDHTDGTTLRFTATGAPTASPSYPPSSASSSSSSSGSTSYHGAASPVRDGRSERPASPSARPDARPVTEGMTGAPGGPRAPTEYKSERQEGASSSSSSYSGTTYHLPEDITAVRDHIEREQRAESDEVMFTNKEIHAEIRSCSNETFTFTDLPGIFSVSDLVVGGARGDLAKSREQNERLREQTMSITKQYVTAPNTIILLVVSATDWVHGISNDPLLAHLAEWLEEIRKVRGDVPVYGVITKLDTQPTLSTNSTVRKIFMGQLGPDHILSALRVRHWIPVVSSPTILTQTDKAVAQAMEVKAIRGCLDTALPAHVVDRLPMGRAALLKHLKQSLLIAIGETHPVMRERMDKLVTDITGELGLLPKVATVVEKCRILEGRLYQFDSTLVSLIGNRGTSPPSVGGERSLRMQLSVDAPASFEKELSSLSLHAPTELVREVTTIIEQAELEQGGGFDSDAAFVALAPKIITHYTDPCKKLVSRCADIVRQALRTAVSVSFKEYPRLETLILSQLGVEDSKESLPNADTHFGLLRLSATHKVNNMLDAFSTMACFHPMWRNFDALYSIILPVGESKASAAGASAGTQEATLQAILNLPELTRIVQTEGQRAITAYEQEKKVTIPAPIRSRITKHFARMEVIAYIVRMSLMSSIYPLIIRDVRDGLFKGITFGSAITDTPFASLLRMKLLHSEDKALQAAVYASMEPSDSDIRTRERLTTRRSTLVTLRADLEKCQEKMKLLDARLSA